MRSPATAGSERILVVSSGSSSLTPPQWRVRKSPEASIYIKYQLSCILLYVILSVKDDKKYVYCEVNTMSIKFTSAYKTDVGKQREQNEDNPYIYNSYDKD